MKNLVLAVAIALLAVGCQAQGPRPNSPQQQLVTTCNYEADLREMKGGSAERSRFVTACLTQGRVRMEEVLKACNAQARTMTGRQRQEFLNECVKG